MAGMGTAMSTWREWAGLLCPRRHVGMTTAWHTRTRAWMCELMHSSERDWQRPASAHPPL
eukprot:362825-Chlamydomonas_euryale.AAC.8